MGKVTYIWENENPLLCKRYLAPLGDWDFHLPRLWLRIIVHYWLLCRFRMETSFI